MVQGRDRGVWFMMGIAALLVACMLCVMLTACDSTDNISNQETDMPLVDMADDGYIYHSIMGDGLVYTDINSVNLYERGEDGAWDIHIDGETPVDTYLSADDTTELMYIISESEYTQSSEEEMPEEDYIYSLIAYDEEGTTVCAIYTYSGSVWLIESHGANYYTISGEKLDAYLEHIENVYGITDISE